MTDPQPEALSIAALITQHRGGKTEIAITEELRELAAAVRHLGKKGKLILTVELNPVTDDGTNLAITIDSMSKAPRTAPPAAHMYVDDEGVLSRTPPGTMPMFPQTDSETTS